MSSSLWYDAASRPLCRIALNFAPGTPGLEIIRQTEAHKENFVDALIGLLVITLVLLLLLALLTRATLGD